MLSNAGTLVFKSHTQKKKLKLIKKKLSVDFFFFCALHLNFCANPQLFIAKKKTRVEIAVHHEKTHTHTNVTGKRTVDGCVIGYQANMNATMQYSYDFINTSINSIQNLACNDSWMPIAHCEYYGINYCQYIIIDDYMNTANFNLTMYSFNLQYTHEFKSIKYVTENFILNRIQNLTNFQNLSMSQFLRSPILNIGNSVTLASQYNNNTIIMQGLQIMGNLWSNYDIYFNAFKHVILYDCSFNRLQIKGWETWFTISHSNFQNFQNILKSGTLYLVSCHALIQGSYFFSVCVCVDVGLLCACLYVYMFCVFFGEFFQKSINTQH